MSRDVRCAMDGCDRPVPDNAYACGTCRSRVRRLLAELPALAGELDITITRQARLGDPAVRHVSTVDGAWWDATGRALLASLPYVWAASDLGWAIDNTLATWCRHIGEERGVALPADRLPAMVIFLVGQVDWLAHRPEATEAFTEFGWLAAAIVRAIDRAPERAYAGPCDGCGEDLYGKLGAAEVRCRTCGQTYPMASRRTWLLAAAEDHLATATQAARALTSLRQERLTPSMIRGMVFRGQLSQHGTDRDGRPLYRIGDIIEALMRRARRAIVG